MAALNFKKFEVQYLNRKKFSVVFSEFIPTDNGVFTYTLPFNLA